MVTTENKSNFVQFNCTSPVNTFQEWRINGTPLFQFRKELPDINITSTQQVGERVPSILYVPTNETSNNTNVTCFAIFDVENDKLSISSTATLLIQGIHILKIYCENYIIIIGVLNYACFDKTTKSFIRK